MAIPDGIGVVDLMIGLPSADRRWWADSMSPLLLDRDSKTTFEHAASYMYKDLPDTSGPETVDDEDRITGLLREMDTHGIERGLIPVSFDDDASIRAVRDHPDRLLGSYLVDPNQAMDTVRDLVRAVEELGAVAAAFFPCGCVPQVPIDNKRVFPVYAKCVELDIPIFVNVGVPGPRVPMKAQKVSRLDQVCWFFPDLRVVMRHGGEPWADLAVKLMVKWPNLFYSTSAFAPRYYPKAIVDFANSSRGAGKVMYAGYYPSGLTLERIFAELPELPFTPEVWPQFLRENALAVLKLETTS
jgi:predicted TIM-barrel fold metal-dependent hydrolase